VPKTVHRRSLPLVKKTDAKRLTRELEAALEQQTAMAEVLRVISSSPTNIEAVLDMVSENAARLCDADNGVITRLEGDRLRVVAQIGQIPTSAVPREGIPVNRDSVNGRAVLERRTIHIHDLAAEDSEFPAGSRYAKIDGFRTTLATPLLREGVPIGTILIRRTEVRPFSQKQIDLLATFASQAVIAIENMRLLNELRQRTSDLSESLEQQTATSEILSSMSGSMTDTKPVFDAIVRNLLRLFGTRFATVHLLKDGMVHLAALDGEPGFERLAANFPRPLDDSTGGRVMHLKQVLQFAPVIDNPATPPATERFAREYTFNSILAAPMMRGHEVIGPIVTARRALSAASCIARAQAYPARPIRLVIPFPPGGAYDAVGRPWADRVKSVLGTVVVENIGGGGSSLGAAAVARARPDGFDPARRHADPRQRGPAQKPAALRPNQGLGSDCGRGR
jgi:two-component system, NtrC family, sensor kinase